VCYALAERRAANGDKKAYFRHARKTEDYVIAIMPRDDDGGMHFARSIRD